MRLLRRLILRILMAMLPCGRASAMLMIMSPLDDELRLHYSYATHNDDLVDGRLELSPPAALTLRASAALLAINAAEQLPAHDDDYAIARHTHATLTWRDCHTAIILPGV